MSQSIFTAKPVVLHGVVFTPKAIGAKSCKGCYAEGRSQLCRKLPTCDGSKRGDGRNLIYTVVDDAESQPVKKPVPDLINHNDTSVMKPSSNYNGKPAVDASTHKPLPYREQSNGKKYLIEVPKNPIFAAIQPDGQQVTMVDWLRVTTNSIEAFAGALGDLEGTWGILTCAGFDVKWKQGKGMHGYTDSASILIWKDNDYLTVGNIAYSEQGQNQGGLFELTGTGCKILQVEYPALWLELYNVLAYHDWRVSRADVALDLLGAYCQEHGITVPRLFRETKKEELFKSDANKNPNFVSQIGTDGDWSDITVGDVSIKDYDPLVHCPAGLTLTIGNRKSSDDYFRCYEKGKEILGKQAEPDTVDRGWVRIEHEMSRKGSGRTIPLDVMIRPDEYFCAGRSNVRAIMEAIRKDRELKAIQCWQREQFKKEKSLLLSRKVHWARYTYGRTVKTMRELNWSDTDIVDALMREAGLKEFIPDLMSYPVNDSDGVEADHQLAA